MAMHAALATVLARLADTDDIAIGTPIAGRGEMALDELVGMFVNTLVLRTRIDHDASFDALLQQVRESDLAAFGHAEVPFERLVEEINPPRSTSYSPLFQVSIEFQNTSDRDSTARPDRRGSRDRRPGRQGRPRVGARREFTDTAIRPGSWRRLTSPPTCSTNPPCAASPTGSSASSRRRRRPGTRRGRHRDPRLRELAALHPRHGGQRRLTPRVPELLESAAAVDPDAVALSYLGRTLTYRQLDERSNRLARVLAGRGVGPETFVALGMPRSIDEIVSIWAVAKSVAAFRSGRSELPGRTHRAHAHRFGCAPRAHDVGTARTTSGHGAVAGPRRRCDRGSARGRLTRAGDRRRPDGAAAPHTSGVPHLHVGIDGPTQGRHRHAPGHREPHREERQRFSVTPTPWYRTWPRRASTLRVRDDDGVQRRRTPVIVPPTVYGGAELTRPALTGRCHARLHHPHRPGLDRGRGTRVAADPRGGGERAHPNSSPSGRPAAECSTGTVPPRPPSRPMSAPRCSPARPSTSVDRRSDSRRPSSTAACARSPSECRRAVHLRPRPGPRLPQPARTDRRTVSSRTPSARPIRMYRTGDVSGGATTTRSSTSAGRTSR